MHIQERYFNFGVRPAIFALSLAPALWLSLGVWFDWLGANPIEVLIRDSGEWALRFLMLTLALSTIRRLWGWAQGMRLRRMLGLYAFFYASLHLFSYLWLDQFFFWEDIWYDIVDRPFITVGMLAFLLMTPLAITSTKAWMRKLGRRWMKLHQLVYPLSIFAVIHFFWLVKADLTEPVIYAVILTFLLGERLYRFAANRDWLSWSYWFKAKA